MLTPEPDTEPYVFHDVQFVFITYSVKQRFLSDFHIYLFFTDTIILVKIKCKIIMNVAIFWR
jgi:hypothetical protein